eukprot:scaffold24759_cov26-Tisochrysis_lutea.AAC.2
MAQEQNVDHSRPAIYALYLILLLIFTSTLTLSPGPSRVRLAGASNPQAQEPTRLSTQAGIHGVRRCMRCKDPTLARGLLAIDTLLVTSSLCWRQQMRCLSTRGRSLFPGGQLSKRSEILALNLIHVLQSVSDAQRLRLSRSECGSELFQNGDFR